MNARKSTVSMVLKKGRKIYLNLHSSYDVTHWYVENKALYTTLETQPP